MLRVFSLFSVSWVTWCFHYFSNTFLYRFWFDFGPQLGVKIHEKSIPRPMFSTSEVTSQHFQDFEGCIGRNARFWGPEASKKAPQIDPKSKKILSTREQFLWWNLELLFYRFLWIFESILGPIFAPKSLGGASRMRKLGRRKVVLSKICHGTLKNIENRSQKAPKSTPKRL